MDEINNIPWEHDFDIRLKLSEMKAIYESMNDGETKNKLRSKIALMEHYVNTMNSLKVDHGKVLYLKY